jgi:phage shock protein E
MVTFIKKNISITFFVLFGFLISAYILLTSNDFVQQSGDVPVLNAGEFFEKSKKDSGIVLDVRTLAEFNAGHVAGSMLIDFREADFEENVKKLDKDKIYYVYCRSGNRSTQATTLMKNLGFKNIYNVKDGIDNILKSGIPVVKK